MQKGKRSPVILFLNPLEQEEQLYRNQQVNSRRTQQRRDSDPERDLAVLPAAKHVKYC